MFTRNIAILLAISGTYASPLNIKRDGCSDTCLATYNTCRGAPGANFSLCGSQYATCLGYSPFNNGGSLVTPTACSKSASATPTAAPSPDTCAKDCATKYDSCRGAPGANFSLCGSQYATCLGYSPFNNGGSLVTPTACSSPAATSTAAATSRGDACAKDCATKYDSCRGAPNANRATCAAEYSSCLGFLPFNSEGSLVTPTACSSTPAATATSTGVPGGCNPAHPGSCPSSYFTYTTATATGAAAATNGASAPAKTAAGEGWTVKSLIRYCAENGSGCDYNFRINFNDGSAEKACTISRVNVSNATTESWFDQPCTSGSDVKVSWGYSTQFTTPFAVMTVVKANQNAYFGINNPNGQAATPGNPSGSGNYGDIGPQPVTTY